MIKFIGALVLSLILFSCTKSGSSNPTIADGSFQYKVNDTLVSVQNVSVEAGEYVICGKQLKGNSIPATRYNFNVVKGSNNIFLFQIPSDSLHVGDYLIETSSAKLYGVITTLLFNANQSEIFLAGDNMKIHISSYQNGLISGTFTAEISPLKAATNFSLQGQTRITEGKFTNIKCSY